MNPKFKGKIINAMRRLTWSYPPRNSVKSRQKRGPNTFECEHCEMWIYEGTRTIDKQREILDCSPSTPLVKGKVSLDHKDAVIPLEGFSGGVWDWNEFVNRLFCEEEGLQVLCTGCHDIKTDLEVKLRAEYRQEKKTLTSKPKSGKMKN